MSVRKLPTDKDIIKSLGDVKALKEKLLEVFEYGTDFPTFAEEAKTESNPQEAAAVLLEVWKQCPEIEDQLVDTVWLVSSLVSGDSQKEALKEMLVSILKVPERESFYRGLQAALDPTLLESTNLSDKDTLMKKLRKLNTEMHYRQQKFNLLHEESEGYAKVLTLLFGDLQDVTPSELQRYMGAFELDPNRILDILLDVLEKTSEDERRNKILELMRDFSTAKIPSLLAFRLTSYQKASKAIPPSLYSVIVILAKNGLLELSSFVPAAEADIEQCYGIYEKFMKQRISAMNRIRLNDDRNKQDPKLVELQNSLEESTSKLGTQNALVGLLKVLLQSHDWDLAVPLLGSEETWTRICTLLPTEIGSTLYDYVLEQISAVFQVQVQVPALVGSPMEETSPEMENLSLEELLKPWLLPLIALAQSGTLATQTILYSKLCRLSKQMLVKEGKFDSISPSVYKFLKVVLVPTLSLFPHNPAISADLWAVLSVLPYSTRYRLYTDWRGSGLERWGMGSKPYLQVQRESEAGKAARYTLKRLSKDNVRDMGRQVSKVTHSNPLVVFTTILNQIESYDNLIQMMVETVRYVTPLSLDVLGYCMLSRLSGSSGGMNRSRLKDDGVNVSQWLQSLESFTGAFYKKCPDVEFRGILCYLIHRLKEGQVLELGVLRSLIKTAGGYSFADYSPTASLSASQLAGRGGSKLLKQQTFAFGVVEKVSMRASKRVRSVLQNDNIGVTLLILLAQLRNRLVFNSRDKRKHVKLIGNLYDSCQVVMSMLLEFITDSSDEEEGGATNESAISRYRQSLPPLSELHSDYGLEPCMAWMLWRPLHHEERNGEHDNGESQDGVISQMAPEAAFSVISPTVFEVFYGRALYDLHFPEGSYAGEIARLKRDEERLFLKKKLNPIDFTRGDDADLDRTRFIIKSLSHDMETQEKHCESVRSTLAAKKSQFFPSGQVSVEAVRALLTHCIFPRCMLSPEDAMYCVHFTHTLHQLETPGFSILHYFDELVQLSGGALYCTTESESAALGILLLECWKIISRWRYDEKAFADEVANKPGAFMVVGEDGQSRVQATTYDQYKLLYNKWHAAIGASAIGCLDSTEYMHLRACFIILSRLVDAYPTRPKLGQKLLDALAPLQDDDYPLQDIKTAAQAYGTLLVKARSSGVWKEEDAAVAKAREDKKKAAIAERKKKAEEQFAEMKRESEKLSEEIGDSRTRGWAGDRDRHPRGDDVRRLGALSGGPPRGAHGRDNPGRDGLAPVRTGHGMQRDLDRDRDRRHDDRRVREGDLRSTRTEERDPGRGRTSERPPPEDRRRGDFWPSEDSRRRGSDDDRWERGSALPSSGRGGPKRDRSPGPDDQPVKRPRSEREPQRTVGGEKSSLPDSRNNPMRERLPTGERGGGYRRGGPRR